MSFAIEQSPTITQEKIRIPPELIIGLFPRFSSDQLLTQDRRDPFLTPELVAYFNQSRNQFVIEQDIGQTSLEQEAQLVAQLREHVLGQPLLTKCTICFRDNQLFFNNHAESFVHQTLTSIHPNSIFKRIEPYWLRKFGYIPTSQQLEFVTSNPDIFRSLISDDVYYQTKLGLEWAEFTGILRLQQQLATIGDGQRIVEFSPGSAKLRPTPIIHHWVRIYEKQGEQIIATYVRSDVSDEEFIKAYVQFAQPNPIYTTVQDIVSHPIVTTANPEQILAALHINQDSQFLELYDRALADLKVQTTLRTTLELMKQKVGLPQIISSKAQLEQEVLKTFNKLFRQYLEEHGSSTTELKNNFIKSALKFLGRGGGCGLAGLLESFVPGFPCPRCGGWIKMGSGDACPSCGYTKNEHAAVSGERCG
ncbi:hypothetical protein GYA49_02415 [Candidatus Beckwithbacteria bacterium]|nr:hypothetical protein [Candidatus Beckwithbacteria bacterium]